SALSSLGFLEGKLLVRYLRVSLISSKLKRFDCDALVVRIFSQLDSWTCKFLSYVGRLQLLKLVIFSMQIYWAFVFILPKKVICSIEKLMRNFLWSGKHNISTKAKIKWDVVCSLKHEGRLGIPNLVAWNKAA